MRFARHVLVLLVLLAQPACNLGGGGAGDLPGSSDTQAFAGLPESERLFFTGTEPFWGGEVQNGDLIYRTPEDPEGRMIDVARFAGRGGLSFSGVLDVTNFDMAVTVGACSDGMSDRTYPYNVTLRLGQELRLGCAWTEAQPYRE